MQTYIVLLRGINVGGNNKVSMKELKHYLDSYFMHVRTYLNSGNIVLDSNKTKEETKQTVEEILLSEFNLTIHVYIQTKENMLLSCKNLPSWWESIEEAKYNVLFVCSDHMDEVVKVFLSHLSVKERIEQCKDMIFFESQGYKANDLRTYLLASKEIYQLITIRNANTYHKLIDMLQ